MAIPVKGNFYRFTNVYSQKRLNLYSAGTASDGLNVVQYAPDTSNEQIWKYGTNEKLHIKTNDTFCLDRYNLSTNANHNNADIWKALIADDANQKIVFEDKSTYVRIKLKSYNLYLTASGTTNGTGTGKKPGVAGNVYWTAPSTSTQQRWTFALVSGSTGGGTTPVSKNYATYPCKTMKITQSYRDGNHASYTDYPFDEACDDTGRSYIYCPCDQMKVVHIYGVGAGGVNTIWLESTSNVVMADGTTNKLTMLVMHPDDDDLSKISIGKIYKRGEAMFREGGDGGNGSRLGNHFHISLGKGIKTGNGWAANANGAWCISTTGGAVKAENVFYRDSKFTTVSQSKGINLKTL